MRPLFHILFHFAVPGIVARYGFPTRWKVAWLIMASTMIVDLDHLLANPIYDPNRCGIGLHPLHTSPAIGVYIVLVLIPLTRLVGLGLLIHMALDAIDCALLRLA